MASEPNTFGRYEIRDEIGRGGMATVYRAYDPRFDRDVALKVLPHEFLHDQSFRARFEREARSIAALEHAAIVPVYDTGEQEGQPYIVMRFMSGGSLTDRIEIGPMTLQDTADVVARMAAALDRAHSKGMIHRDVKPRNILFDEYGDSFLSDFGIVKISEGSAQLTGTGFVGTVYYAAPELTNAGGLSPLVDVYALAVTVYEMLAGVRPYNADTPVGVIMAHASSPIPNLLAVRYDLPVAVQDVIERGMAKDPAFRYQSAGDLAAGLQQALMVSPNERTTPMEIDQNTLVEPSMDTYVENVSWDAPPASAPSDDMLTMPELTVSAASTPSPPQPPTAAAGQTAPRTAKSPRARRTRKSRSGSGRLLAVFGVGGLLLAGIVIALVVLLSGGPAQILPPGFPYEAGTTLVPVQLVARDGDAAGLAYSPDGSRLAFTIVQGTDSNPFSDLYVLGPTGQAERLTNNISLDVSSSYSPDGSTLAFHSNRTGNFEIFALDETGSPVQLTSDPGSDYCAVYNPRGDTIAFVSDRDGDPDIYILGPDGNPVALTSNSGNEFCPTYSPDGSTLTFASERDGNVDIYALGSSGNATRLTEDPAEDRNPVYSPDGSQLAFISDRSGLPAIYILDSTGSARRIWDRVDFDCRLAVSPTTGKITYCYEGDIYLLDVQP